MAEFWDVYDQDRKLRNKTHKRGVPLEDGEYHLVVEVWTINNEGKMLLTKRHPNKPFGEMWECTGGSVIAGEDSITGARRELQEEVGIVVENTELQLLGTVTSRDAFVDTYLVHYDAPIEELILQAEEVVEAKWVSIAKFEAICTEGEVVPTVIHRYELYKDKLFECINKNAWEYRAYEYWNINDGKPQDLADKIMKDPMARLKYHGKYFEDIKGKKVANPCGSNGRRAVALALLGAEVTIFDISEENKKYAIEMAECAQAQIEYVVCNLYDVDIDIYGGYFDVLYLEGGILHYFHSIDQLMSVLYQLLKKNGMIILNDFHPFRKVMPINYFKSSNEDYFETKLHDGDLAYKDFVNIQDGEQFPSCVLRLYTISDILNAMIKNGFYIKEFNEHPSWTNAKLPGEFTVIATK